MPWGGDKAAVEEANRAAITLLLPDGGLASEKDAAMKTATKMAAVAVPQAVQAWPPYTSERGGYPGWDCIKVLGMLVKCVICF